MRQIENTHIIATGSVAIGSYIHIGAHCHLAGRGGIIMADFSGLSQGVRIYTTSNDYGGEYMTSPWSPITSPAQGLSLCISNARSSSDQAM